MSLFGSRFYVRLVNDGIFGGFDNFVVHDWLAVNIGGSRFSGTIVIGLFGGLVVGMFGVERYATVGIVLVRAKWRKEVRQWQKTKSSFLSELLFAA